VILLSEAVASPSASPAPSRQQGAPLADLARRLAADGRAFRELSLAERRARLSELIGVGRGLLSSSEEFAAAKRQEIALEARRLGR
jgi:hypothetical protein